MRRVFIVCVYKKQVSLAVQWTYGRPNGRKKRVSSLFQWAYCTKHVYGRLMLGKHKTTAYVVISELEDYGTMPADPATSNCDLRNVHEYSSVMSLMLVGNVTCCFVSKVNLLYLLYLIKITFFCFKLKATNLSTLVISIRQHHS